MSKRSTKLARKRHAQQQRNRKERLANMRRYAECVNILERCAIVDITSMRDVTPASVDPYTNIS